MDTQIETEIALAIGFRAKLTYELKIANGCTRAAMPKRIFAFTVGLLALVAGIIGLAYATEGISDFTNPAVSLRVSVLGEFLLCSMAFVAFGIGVRFLKFARYGRTDQSRSWARPVLLGIGFFFPGFLFSLPLTILWARHAWPGDGQSDFAAMEISVYAGIAAALICWLLLWKKSRTRRIP